MKELSIEEKAKAYDEAKLRMSAAYNSNRCTIGFMNEIFPELKESEDERIRKALIEMIHDTPSVECEENYKVSKEDVLAWLEKQCQVKESVISQHENKTCKENSNSLTSENEQKTSDKVEPKFKVKLAGREYDVLEIKESAGVKFYGIEDEPNHIDYILSDDCEIISGYGVKEKGSSYPTKSAIFSEQKPTWSEEDEKTLQGIWDEILANKHDAKEYEWKTYDRFLDWLKSIKDRVGCEANFTTTWKPSEEQIEALEHFVRSIGESGYASPYENNTKLLYSLLEQLKKL